MNNWKFADEKETIVVKTNSDGSMESCLVIRQDVQEYLAAGGVIAPASTLAEHKSMRINRINAEAFSRTTAKWPLWLQSNIALGLDPLLAQSCKDNIAAVRVASNTASDAVNAALDKAGVDSVIVNWPVI